MTTPRVTPRVGQGKPQGIDPRASLPTASSARSSGPRPGRWLVWVSGLGVSCAASVIALALASCSSDKATPADASAPDASAACPEDLPKECPTPPPSYQADVKGIIDARCNTCHRPGGQAGGTFEFGAYDQVARLRSPMLNQVFSCGMPPPDAGQLTPAERAKLLGWLVCKAPNN